MRYPGSDRPIWPRNPDAKGLGRLDRGTRSLPVDGAAALPPSMEQATEWSPYGTFVPRPFESPYHDGLPRAFMAVAQAGVFDSGPCPFPANSTWDVPNAQHAASGILRLRPTTSAHPGATQPVGPGPMMVFTAPPIFGYQTRPIMATGL